MSNKTSDKNVGSIDEDVKRCNELTKVKHANWIGISNQLAILHILAEREQMLKAINTVEKEKEEWIKAYQEEKDKQFELIKRIKELEEENAMLKKASNIARDVNIEEVTEVMNKSYEEFMSNYINKQALIDTINENGFEVYTKEYGNVEVISIDVLQELLEGEK